MVIVYPHNPTGFTDSCVFVTIARLLRTTPQWVSETTGYLTGNLWLNETYEVLPSTGYKWTWCNDGSSTPPAGATNEYGMLYTGVAGNYHAVVVERVGNQWCIYDYTDRSGRKWMDWNEVASVSLIFWRC